MIWKMAATIEDRSLAGCSARSWTEKNLPDPQTTKTNRPNSQGPTGDWSSADFYSSEEMNERSGLKCVTYGTVMVQQQKAIITEDLGTFPRIVTYFSAFSLASFILWVATMMMKKKNIAFFKKETRRHETNLTVKVASWLWERERALAVQAEKRERQQQKPIETTSWFRWRVTPLLQRYRSFQFWNFIIISQYLMMSICWKSNYYR